MRRFLFVIIIFMTFIASGCTTQKPSKMITEKDTRIVVYASFYPYHFITEYFERGY